jgi:PadR family transcriptional regulator, regulatory protein PadR
MSEVSKDLVAASSRMMILSILSGGESYGYQILHTVKYLTEGGWIWSDGLIYPVLHKLENEKMISARWEQIENGRNRKYYKITDKGMKSLEKSMQEWNFVDATFRKVWGTKTCNPSPS